MAVLKELEHKFEGVRLQIDTDLSFEDVQKRLHELCGKSSLAEINELATAVSSEEEYAEKVKERFVGPSGFMLFSEVEHTRWLQRYGFQQRVLRVILGNPLIAITMMRHDVSAGLFAPVEILLVSTESGTTIHWLQPSSAIAIRGDETLKKAAEALDSKLHALIHGISER